MRANARPSPSLIARSYLADLRQWNGHLVTGYALACGFMRFNRPRDAIQD
ncbi:hypothetical protein V5279_22210 [Bradyrhizobium sp. 26S5]